MQYSDLNQPQHITAPSTVRPFSEFQAKLAAFVQALQGAASGALGSGGAPSGGASTASAPSAGSSTGSGSSAGSSSSVQKYGQCIQQAGGDVSKMQKCAALLGSG